VTLRSEPPAAATGSDAAARRLARERLIGIALVIVSASFFAGVDAFSKLLAETQSVGQVVWGRYAMAIPIMLAMTRPARLPTLLRTARPSLQILRGLTPLTISAMMVLAVRHLPLAEATVILYAAPFLVVALSGPLLGERVGLASWLGVVVGFAAVLIVARPGFGELSRFTIFPAIGALFYAVLQLVTRTIAAKGESPDTTLAWTLLTGAAVSTPIAILTWAPVDLRGWLLMLGLGTVFGLSQGLMIRAFAYAPAGLLAPLTYFQIVSATFLSVAVFGDVPDLWTLVGSLMIIVAGVYVARRRAG
jgi:drug/metabolite transporter (DMT)-like permease